MTPAEQPFYPGCFNHHGTVLSSAHRQRFNVIPLPGLAYDQPSIGRAKYANARARCGSAVDAKEPLKRLANFAVKYPPEGIPRSRQLLPTIRPRASRSTGSRSRSRSTVSNVRASSPITDHVKDLSTRLLAYPQPHVRATDRAYRFNSLPLRTSVAESDETLTRSLSQ